MSTEQQTGPPKATMPDASFEVARSLGRIEGRIEQAFGVQAAQTALLDNHEKRIVILETHKATKKAWSAGAWWVLAGLSAAAGTIISIIIGVWGK